MELLFLGMKVLGYKSSTNRDRRSHASTIHF